MKVTEVRVLSADRFNYVKVETDESIHGVGELHLAFGTSGTPFAAIGGVRYCAEYLAGEDPLPIERHWEELSTLDLDAFPEARLKKPTSCPWRREIRLIAPGEVCWPLREAG